jgi:hypothetical protein
MPSTRSSGEELEQQVSEPERLLRIRRKNLENQIENPLPEIVKRIRDG